MKKLPAIARTQCTHIELVAVSFLEFAEINLSGQGWLLLGICFWRKVREERVWTEFIGEKGG